MLHAGHKTNSRHSHHFLLAAVVTLAIIATGFLATPIRASDYTLYYNNDRGDGDWSNYQNWWYDVAHT
jgi:hypothetical protein